MQAQCRILHCRRGCFLCFRGRSWYGAWLLGCSWGEKNFLGSCWSQFQALPTSSAGLNIHLAPSEILQGFAVRTECWWMVDQAVVGIAMVGVLGWILWLYWPSAPSELWGSQYSAGGGGDERMLFCISECQYRGAGWLNSDWWLLRLFWFSRLPLVGFLYGGDANWWHFCWSVISWCVGVCNPSFPGIFVGLSFPAAWVFAICCFLVFLLVRHFLVCGFLQSIVSWCFCWSVVCDATDGGIAKVMALRKW